MAKSWRDRPKTRSAEEAARMASEALESGGSFPAEEEAQDASAELPYAVRLAMEPSGAPLRQPETPSGWRARPAVAPMSAGRAGLLGVASGATADFVDELGGGLAKLLGREPVKVNAAALEPQPGDSEEVATLKKMIAEQQATQPTTYDLGRDAIRREQQRALMDQPGSYISGQLGGAAATSYLGGAAGLGKLGLRAVQAVPKVGQALGSAAPLAQAARGFAGGALGGALQGAGASEAQDAGGVLEDALLSAGIGGGLGAVPGLVKGAARLPGAIRARAAKGVAKAEEDILEKARKAQEKLEQSAHGTVRAETQKGSRYGENLQRYELDPSADPATKADIEAWRQTEEARNLARKVAENTLKESPGQERAIRNAEQTYQDLLAAREGNIAADVKRGLDPKVAFNEQVMKRVRTMGTRAILPALSAAGGWALGDEDSRGQAALASGGLGSILSFTVGNPTQTIANMFKNPAFRRLAWNATRKATTPAASAAETLLELAGSPVGQRVAQGAEFMSGPAGRVAASQTTGAAQAARDLRALLDEAEREREQGR